AGPPAGCIAGGALSAALSHDAGATALRRDELSRCRRAPAPAPRGETMRNGLGGGPETAAGRVGITRASPGAPARRTTGDRVGPRRACTRRRGPGPVPGGGWPALRALLPRAPHSPGRRAGPR